MLDPVKISKALSEPARYKIMLMLVNQYYREVSQCCSFTTEGVCNCEIMAEFGMIQSRVSYHMKELTEAGLVTEKPCGKWKYYIPNAETLKNYINQLGVDFKL
ncbi:MAG: HTH-type transcriptional repressor AseR [Pelotomaculum sp. PtaU1.Bin035]|nr:MAG: HTH-type transcriptional repressor AseR [Pelotomaculum sp. PtaU1.Bin035]